MDLLDTLLDRTLIGYSRAGLVRRAWWPADPPPGALAGRVAVVTGARSGLGAATVAGLARLGVRVHMVVRDAAAAEPVRAEIAEAVPGAELVLDTCDVSSLAAVRDYAAGWDGPLHALVHNAGVLPPHRELTAEGHELAFATHVLGPHHLTDGLLPALRAGDEASPARVIWVTSGGMYAQRLHVDDLEFAHGDYSGTAAYARTKRMQVALAREWGERLAGQGVVVHAAHPGWADTPGLAASLPRFRTLARPLLRTPGQGADTIVWLAAAPEAATTTGQLWHDRRVRPRHYLRTTRDTAQERQILWSAMT